MVGLNILVVGGDDYGYHDFSVIGKVFHSFLYKAGFHVEITGDCSAFLPENIKKYDVIVCYMNRKRLPENQEHGLLESISGSSRRETGKPKGFIGIHTAACSFPDSTAYQKMLGCRFLTHPKMGEALAVQIKKPGHPIMQGIQQFTIIDELYLMEIFPPFELLLSCQYKGFDRPLAWVKPYGLGRVFYLCLGHGIEQLQNAFVKKMIINAINWSVEGE